MQGVAAKDDASYDLSRARASVTGQTTIAASTATRSLPNGRIVTALFAGALFLSAFLLFVLEPMGTKLIFGSAERTLRCGVPITPRLSQKLQQTLGGQEGAEFVNWMHQMDARASDVATHGDLAELRAELRADIAELRQEMRVGFVKIHEEMAHLEIRFERRFGDLIKWSFVFWVGE